MDQQRKSAEVKLASQLSSNEQLLREAKVIHTLAALLVLVSLSLHAC